MTLKELQAKIEDVKYETVTGPFSTFYEPMKAIYDELMVKHGGNLDKVRAEMPKKNYVVSKLPPYIRELLNETKAESLFFSTDTLAKQLKHHPELTPAEYVSVFNKLKSCDEIREAKYGRIALIVKDGQCYAVLLKTTDDKLENYIVSLYRLNKDSLREFRKLKRIY